MRANCAVLRVTRGISNCNPAAPIHKPCDPGKVLAARKRGVPSNEIRSVGFRVASVPEPSTYVLIALAGAVLVARVVVRRRRS